MQAIYKVYGSDARRPRSAQRSLGPTSVQTMESTARFSRSRFFDIRLYNDRMSAIRCVVYLNGSLSNPVSVVAHTFEELMNVSAAKFALNFPVKRVFTRYVLRIDQVKKHFFLYFYPLFYGDRRYHMTASNVVAAVQSQHIKQHNLISGMAASSAMTSISPCLSATRSSSCRQVRACVLLRACVRACVRACANMRRHKAPLVRHELCTFLHVAFATLDHNFTFSTRQCSRA